MKKILFIFILSAVFANSQAQPKTYFPKNTFSDFVTKWYSSQLEAMDEPIVYNDNTNKEIYRFTWLRTFDHPVAIRIEKGNGKYMLYWKECNGAGGYGPGKLITSREKPINKDTWDMLMHRLKQISFWTIATKDTTLGNDGAEWILEGKLPGTYHVVDRWSPAEGTDYYKCCDLLIGLTNLSFPKGRKY